jgi:hypothetical protein
MKLKENFPVLYSITREKDASVAANVEFLGGVPQWNVIFSREVHDWEVNVVTALFQKLQFVSIQRGSPDKLWWISSKKGTFKVEDFFRALSRAKGRDFLGRVCGEPSLPQGLHSLCDRQCSGKFLLWII